MKKLDARVGDIVMLRKPHPCGSYEWRVTRIGADIGLTCQKCARHIMMPRSKFNKHTKKLVSRADASPEG